MLRIERGNGAPELYLYGDIAQQGGWYASESAVAKEDVLDALAAVAGEKEIVVRIASQGGDVMEGVAIYQALTRFPGRVRVEVDSLAASIASVIAMAGDEIVMGGNSRLGRGPPRRVVGEGTAQDPGRRLGATHAPVLTPWPAWFARHETTLPLVLAQEGWCAGAWPPRWRP